MNETNFKELDTDEYTRDITDPDKKRLAKMTKYEDDFKGVITTVIAAPGARKSRLEALKFKLDKFAKEIRDEQQLIRQSVLVSIENLPLNEIGSKNSEQEADDRAKLLLDVQRRIINLRKEVQNEISAIVD